MTIVVIKNSSCMLTSSISNVNESVGSCLEIKCINNKDISMTLKYKTHRDNCSIPMSYLH